MLEQLLRLTANRSTGPSRVVGVLDGEEWCAGVGYSKSESSFSACLCALCALCEKPECRSLDSLRSLAMTEHIGIARSRVSCVHQT
jgi:hypothetical protein